MLKVKIKIFFNYKKGDGWVPNREKRKTFPSRLFFENNNLSKLSR